MRDKVRRCALHLADEVRKRYCCGQSDQQMHVIFDSAECNEFTTEFRTFRGDGPTYLAFKRIGEQWQAIPGSPDKMHIHCNA